MKAILIIFLFTIKLFAHDIFVIMNSDAEIKEKHFTSKQIRRIFRGDIKKIDNSGVLRIGIQRKNTFKPFCSHVIGKTPKSLATHWAMLALTGKATPAQKFKNDEEMIKWVKKTSNAIGFIKTSNMHKDKNIKVVYKFKY